MRKKQFTKWYARHDHSLDRYTDRQLDDRQMTKLEIYQPNISKSPKYER